MTQLQNLKDLFHDQLRDIYNAETHLIEALPEMRENAHSDELKNAFSEHLEETQNQKQRLEEIADQLGITISGKKCEAMEGLIREAHELLSEDVNNDVRDAGLILDAQKIEHYEMAVYGAAREYAKALDEDAIAEKLNQSLQEESGADSTLNEIAMDSINMKAMAGG